MCICICVCAFVLRGPQGLWSSRDPLREIARTYDAYLAEGAEPAASGGGGSSSNGHAAAAVSAATAAAGQADGITAERLRRACRRYSDLTAPENGIQITSML